MYNITTPFPPPPFTPLPPPDHKTGYHRPSQSVILQKIETMKIPQVILVLSSIMVIDARSTQAKQPEIKTGIKADKKIARITSVQSDGNNASMAGLMGRVRRGGWDRN